MTTTPCALLRKNLRQQRKALDKQTQSEHALALENHIKKFPLFKRSKHIAVYLAADGEIDPSFIIKRALRLNKKIYLPILSPFGHRLYFAPFTENCKMKLNRYQIAEPDVSPSLWLKPRQLDLILMPLVGFDKFGNRLGMGGGYYDRSFSFYLYRKSIYKPYLIGLAHQLQEVERLAVQAHDIPMQFIATEQHIQRCK